MTLREAFPGPWKNGRAGDAPSGAVPGEEGMEFLLPPVGAGLPQSSRSPPPPPVVSTMALRLAPIMLMRTKHQGSRRPSLSRRPVFHHVMTHHGALVQDPLAGSECVESAPCRRSGRTPHPASVAPRIRAVRREEFSGFLAERPRVADGALGTALYLGGVAVRRCFDDLNRSDPSRVHAIHAAHRTAGAEILTTNTFGANRFKLRRYGLASEVRVINEAGVAIARRAAGDRALVFGSVGPTGESIGPFPPDALRDEVRAAFREQLEALLDAGVDGFQIETFTSLGECLLALEAAREVAPDVAVTALVTFSEQGTARAGERAEVVAAALEAAGADAVGSNCGLGPATTLDAVEKMRSATRLPLVAQPNAGVPERVDDRFLYPSSPDYMAHFAKRYLRLGVRLLGGCCGTAEEHLGAIAGAVRALSAGQRVITPAPTGGDARPRGDGKAPAPDRNRSRLGRALADGEFVVSVELDPPRGASATRLLERARMLRDAGIRFVNIADGPRASARMSAIAFAALLERENSVETILHYQCRDRNLIGIQADLLGAHALGIRNVLAVTGDPPKLGDYPHATAVFDLDSVGLVRILSSLNRGLDLAGNPVGAALPFLAGVGANPAVVDFEAEVAKFERKVAAGASFALTQPVYEARVLERFLEAVREFRVPVLVGVLPLVSSRNAEFLHHEVPGMTVAKEVRDRMAGAGSAAEARSIGVEVARDMVAVSRRLAEGVYVMPPFHRYELAVRCVEGFI